MIASVEIDDALSERIQRLAETCRQPVDQLILDAIVLYAERLESKAQADVADLRRAWQDGIASGDAAELDFEALKAEGRARVAAAKA